MKATGLSQYKLYNKTTGATMIVKKGIKGMTLMEKNKLAKMGWQIVESIKIDYDFYNFIKKTLDK